MIKFPLFRHATSLSLNILNTDNKSPLQMSFLKKISGELLPTLKFLGRLYNFCTSVIIFSLM